MKKILVFMVVILIAMQFFRIDKNNPVVKPEEDIVTVLNLPENERNILKKACYDCHSNEVIYPWYSNVAPVSWYIKLHVNRARTVLNFSEWTKYNDNQKNKLIKANESAFRDGWMPLDSYHYFGLHSDGKLTQEERNLMSEKFASLGNAGNNDNTDNTNKDK